MGAYFIHRILLLPLTLGCILLVNFLIIHLVPGDPSVLSSLGDSSGMSTASQGMYGGESNRQFRLRYGLTLPILWNGAIFYSREEVLGSIKEVLSQKSQNGIRSLKDQAPFILDPLFEIIQDSSEEMKVRQVAAELFLLGSVQLLPTDIKSLEYEKVADSNYVIDQLRERFTEHPSFDVLVDTIKNEHLVPKSYSISDKLRISITQTRLVHYLNKVIHLDFGTKRNDPYVPVVDVVLSKLSYSLTLSGIPFFGTFILALFLGLFMAARSGKYYEVGIDLFLLILFAIPIFVVTPYLLEKAMGGMTIPFTSIRFPLKGFSSDESAYNSMNSWQRLLDISKHLILPLLCLSYNLIAVQARLAKASFVEASSKDYVRFALSKGVRPKALWLSHILPNGSIPLVTLAAGSLGVLLGGSVIVETLFDIPGFGKFFYDSIIERDYNVLLFSSLIGSLLTLIGYLVADIVYCILDPRVNFQKRQS